MDFLDYLSDLVSAAMPADEWSRIERVVRAEWSGDRPFIASKSRRERKKRMQAAIDYIAAGMPKSKAAEASGISRRHIYRLLAKKP